MENCLKAQLKGVVQNDNLIKMDEFMLKLSIVPQQVTVQFSPASNVNYRTLDGLTDSNDNTSGSLSNITRLRDTFKGLPGRLIVDNKDKVYLIEAAELASIDSIVYLKNLNSLNLNREGLYPFTWIKPLLDKNQTIHTLGFAGNKNAGVSTDISFFYPYTQLKSLALGGRGVTGDIALFTNLYYFYGYSTSDRECSWSSRPNTAPLLGGNFNLGEDVDKMLLDNAECSVSPDAPSNRKYIEVTGTCSFSTEVTNAIASIKAKGYSVTINGVAQ